MKRKLLLGFHGSTVNALIDTNAYLIESWTKVAVKLLSEFWNGWHAHVGF